MHVCCVCCVRRWGVGVCGLTMDRLHSRVCGRPHPTARLTHPGVVQANQDVQQLEGWLLDAYSLAADSYLAGTQDGSATASLQQAGGSSSAPAARPAGAARAALMALELLPVAGAEARQRELQGKLRAATEKLSSGQVHQLYQRVAQEAARGAGGGQARHKARSAFARQHMLAPVAPASASDGDTPAQVGGWNGGCIRASCMTAAAA